GTVNTNFSAAIEITSDALCWTTGSTLTKGNSSDQLKTNSTSVDFKFWVLGNQAATIDPNLPLVSSSGGLTKGGTGTLILPSSSSTNYAGLNFIDAGVVKVSGVKSLGAAATSNNTTVASGAVLDANGVNFNPASMV